MKKNIVIVLLLIVSIGSLGYITYDTLLKEENIELKECNKEEICDECICDNDYENDDESSNLKNDYVLSDGDYFTKLEVYETSNIKNKDVIINGQIVNLKYNENNLYVNDKKTSHDISRVYITDYYIFTVAIGQAGEGFISAIDELGNITDLSFNSEIGDFQAYNIFLSGSRLAAAGTTNPGCIDCEFGIDSTLVFSRNNNKLEISKRNGYNPW